RDRPRDALDCERDAEVHGAAAAGGPEAGRRGRRGAGSSVPCGGTRAVRAVGGAGDGPAGGCAGAAGGGQVQGLQPAAVGGGGGRRRLRPCCWREAAYWTCSIGWMWPRRGGAGTRKGRPHTTCRYLALALARPRWGRESVAATMGRRGDHGGAMALTMA